MLRRVARRRGSRAHPAGGAARRTDAYRCVRPRARPLRLRAAVWFNGSMAGFQDTATGHHDLEPFWPSRQNHDFDRVCCRAWIALAL